MPADLEAVDALAQVIGVMNGPAREPEHLFLELAQDRELLGWNWFGSPGHRHGISLGRHARECGHPVITIVEVTLPDHRFRGICHSGAAFRPRRGMTALFARTMTT